MIEGSKPRSAEQQSCSSDRNRAADRYRVLIEVSPQAIWEADPQGALLFLNQYALDYAGLASEQLVADGWVSIVHPEHRDRTRQEWLGALQRAEPWEFEVLFRRSDGEHRWFVLRGSPMKDACGNVIRWVGIALDIHERKLANRELRRLAATLEERVAERTQQLADANQAKSDFLAHMSHEIRTPLTGVLGLSELMASEPLPDAQRERLALLRLSAKSLQRLLTDILDFAKIEAGKLTLEALAFNPKAVVDQAVALFEGAAANKSTSMSLHCEQLPNRCVGDPTRLRQVLLNLVGNAVKFTDGGGIEVRAWSTEAGTRLHFSVRDTGIGLSAQARSHLFEAFTQADASTARRYGGTGLGLAICKRLVEAMGGQVHAHPADGGGSLFKFDVRVLTAQSIALDAPEAAHLPALFDPGICARLLLAEDDDVNRTLITAMLERMGHLVDAVRDGHEALTAFEQDSYDVVVTDLRMPGMDGEALAKRIRALRSSRGCVPVIALSADALELKRLAASSAFDDFVVKPVDWQQLHEAIQRQLANPDSGDTTTLAQIDKTTAWID